MRWEALCAAALAAGVLSVANVPPLHAQSAPPVHWAKVSVVLPVGDVAFPPGDGAQIATEYCLMCHSSGMVLRQPPLSQAQWMEEIRKMREFFGSPMPFEQDLPLARYLAKINGPVGAGQAPRGASAK